jgi:dTDP-4-amino-4,6-dideoxygalactose transaminase
MEEVMKKIQVTRSSMPDFNEYLEEIKGLWDSRWLTNMGEKHEMLEKQLSKYLQVPNTTLFTNGHLALEVAIASLGLTGEIITTPFTFASTTHAIVRNGLTPVFCDIDPVTYTIDVSKIESLITEKTTAIIPVHVYGNVCDVEAIEEIAKKYKLKVIYDAAHAFGVTINGNGIATYGDASMFSFHSTKVFNTIEGGAITYNNAELKKKLLDLKNFGITSPESVEYVGGNAKMNEFQAAMGLCNLRYVDEEIKKRKRAYERYEERLGGIGGIRLNTIQSGVKRNYSYFAVIFDGYKMNRDQVAKTLENKNIFARKYFYPLTNDFECYRGVVNPGDTPIARNISKSILCLPMYADLTIEEVDRICDAILK